MMVQPIAPQVIGVAPPGPDTPVIMRQPMLPLPVVPQPPVEPANTGIVPPWLR